MFRGKVSTLVLYAIAAIASVPTIAVADETGVSAWLPGTFWSLAAVPSQPGCSVATFYYHTSVSANADVARAREIQIGEFNPTLSAKLSEHIT
jgi:hypothetical protein